MDARKMRILQAITDDYIMTAEPVGSRTVARRYDLGVSPATIRNEMADLEELGYLQQPHTSAGRIPSDKGYRYYVDALMEPQPPSEEERRQIRSLVSTRRQAMEELIHRAARLLALLSRYTVMVVAPRLSAGVVHHLQLVPLDGWHVMVVLVVQPGFVLNRVVELRDPLAEAELQRLSAFLNERLRGRMVGDLGPTLYQELRDELPDPEMARAAIEMLEEALSRGEEETVYLDGTVNLLNQPEFRDVEKAKTLLTFLDEREQVLEMLSASSRRSGVSVTIGSEHTRQEVQSCSVVTATYHVGGRVVGTVGVMGPTRMEYARVVTLVEMLTNSLSETLTQAMKR